MDSPNEKLSGNKRRILVVEDEVAIRAGLLDVLVFHGFEVDSAEDGEQGLAKAKTGQYDLVLLDIMLPKLNGYDVCNAIREQDRSLPIVMLTARVSDEDIVRGLELGADDYVAKPFSVAQLVLRIKAVLRRAYPAEDLTIVLGPWQVDTLNLSAETAGGNPPQQIAFTRREMDIVEYLHSNNARPVPREELLVKVWGYAPDIEIETRTVDIHMAKIRRKIEAQPKEPQLLVTVRGAGYRLMSS